MKLDHQRAKTAAIVACPSLERLAAVLSTNHARICGCYLCCKMQYISRMDAEKTIGISFRISPRTKHLLAAAAEHERRSLTNMVEVLVEDYCRRQSIGFEGDETTGLPRATAQVKGGRVNG